MKLNLPKNKDNRFDVVSFVNDMNHFQLKILVKRLWENFQSLATVVEPNRKDITNAIDSILSGSNWSPKDITNRYRYTICNGNIIQYDSATDQFNSIKVINGKLFIEGEKVALDYDQIMKMIK